MWSTPFSPTGLTSTIAVTTSNQRIALTSKCSSILVQNTGSTEAFFEQGDSTVTAIPCGNTTSSASGSTPILPGQSRVFSSNGQSNVAAITSSGTTTIRITPGEGGK